jgi:hypothetical protein
VTMKSRIATFDRYNSRAPMHTYVAVMFLMLDHRGISSKVLDVAKCHRAMFTSMTNLGVADPGLARSVI